MTNNPGDDNELFNLFVNVEIEVANQKMADFQAQIDRSINRAIEMLGAGDNAAYEFVNALNEVKMASYSSGENLNLLSKELQLIEEEYQGVTKSALDAAVAMRDAASTNKQMMEGGSTLGEMLTGYGVSGGMVGPAALGDVSGSSGGSLFGVGRGLSAAGSLLGAPALSQAGGLIYMEEGLKKAVPFLERFNETITATPGLLGPVVSGFTALGIPMAGLAAVVAPVAIAVAGLALILKAFEDAAERGRVAMQSAINVTDAYFKGIELGTSDVIKKQSEELAFQNAMRTEELELLKKRRAELAPNQFSTYAEYTGATTVLDEKIVTLAEDSKNAADTINGLNSSLDSLPVKIADATAKFLADYDKEINARAQNADREAEIERQHQRDLAMTSEQLKKRLDFLRSEGAILDAESKSPSLEGTDPVLTAKREALEAAAQAMRDEIAFITHNLMAGTVAAEQFAVSVKTTTELFGLLSKVITDFSADIKALQQDTFNKITDAQAKELRAEQEFTRGSLQDTEARYKIALDMSRKETDIRNATAQKIDDIEQKFADKQTDLNTELSRKLQDDLLNFNNNRAKTIRSYEDQEIEDRIDHAQKIAELSQVSNLDIEDALLDRNFLEINQAKKHQQESIQQENDDYVQREAKQRRHLDEQIRELGINYQQQQQQDRLAAARKLQDAALAQTREIQLAQTAEARKLTVIQTYEAAQIADLDHAENYKLQVLRKSLRDQIDLMVQTESAKETLLQQQMNKVLGQTATSLARQFFNNPGAVIQAAATPQGIAGIAGIAANLFGAASRFFDDGGAFGAGEGFTMSENRTESLNMGGASYMIPGQAMVIPMQSGSVGRNAGSGGTYNFYIQSNDPEGVRREITSALKQVMG